MNVKSVITLFLALVFQLAQIQAAAVVTSPCPSNGAICSCCEGADSCPCAKNGESDQKPPPLVPHLGNVLKLPAAKTGETHVSIEPLDGNYLSPTLAVFPVTGPSGGYAGVRLAVAHCSFVI